MSQYTKHQLSIIETRKRVIKQVKEGKLSVNSGASILGMTRQGFWKLRCNYDKYGEIALIGRKRGPKSWYRVHNRTPEWAEEQVEQIYLKHGGGPDTLLWIIEDYYHDQLGFLKLSRSTIYRILVRRCLINQKKQDKKTKKHNHKYTKGYPGEEIQIDTTEPFGKGNGWLINFVDDYSRWKASYFYPHNNSLSATYALKHFILTAPFPVEAVRVDNGPEFKKHFAKYCQQAGIRLIRNRPKTPEHNGKVERLHRTVEEECLWHVPEKYRNAKDKKSLEYVNYVLAQHTLWYNTKRRHLGYKMDKKTPQQKIEDWLINNYQIQSSGTKEDVNETLILYRA